MISQAGSHALVSAKNPSIHSETKQSVQKLQTFPISVWLLCSFMA